MKLTPPTDIAVLSQDLGIGPAQLSKLRVKFKTAPALLATLQQWWVETREAPLLLARRHIQGYTHQRAEAMRGHLTDNGYEDEPEAVDPNEIESYRSSKEARLRRQHERAEELGDLLGAMTDLRAALDEMNPVIKRQCSRTIWVLRSKLDTAERDLRRSAA